VHFWGCEEEGLYGPAYYLEQHPPAEVADQAANLNEAKLTARPLTQIPGGRHQVAAGDASVHGGR
jgi:Zn-dependent M28 family amino/carboxypeptidase